MASPAVPGRDPDAERGRPRPGTGGVLHDLGQPLAAIRALASAPLPGDETAGAEAADRLRRIDGLAGWMTALLREADASVDRPTGRSADAAAVALEVVVSAATTYQGELRCHPCPAAAVLLDPLELRRAIGNVVDNASRAAGPDGRVDVRIRRVRGRVRIEVADDGPGFGLVPRQTGRGLAVALEVAAGCGGALAILDRPPRGTLVRLELPLAGAGAPA